MKISLCNSILLRKSQKIGAIKLIERKAKYQKLIKNWRPVLLLNLDAKFICEALADRLKKKLFLLLYLKIILLMSREDSLAKEED